VAQGTSRMQVGEQAIELEAHDLVVVEPGEAHTFLSSSHDYFHFVIQTPGLQGDAAAEDKVEVSTETRHETTK
jgi:quercetin dioxygenase-like cupin family protein